MAGSLAYGVSRRQERQYQALLSAGRQVPPGARVLTRKDWLPTVVFFSLMAALIIGALVAAYREPAPR
jgi:quinol-cytochrome oxidoreductase complex cytochrome b subunit